jgi:hypothetical protein
MKIAEELSEEEQASLLGGDWPNSCAILEMNRKDLRIRNP